MFCLLNPPPPRHINDSIVLIMLFRLLSFSNFDIWRALSQYMRSRMACRCTHVNACTFNLLLYFSRFLFLNHQICRYAPLLMLQCMCVVVWVCVHLHNFQEIDNASFYNCKHNMPYDFDSIASNAHFKRKQKTRTQKPPHEMDCLLVFHIVEM